MRIEIQKVNWIKEIKRDYEGWNPQSKLDKGDIKRLWGLK